MMISMIDESVNDKGHIVHSFLWDFKEFFEKETTNKEIKIENLTIGFGKNEVILFDNTSPDKKKRFCSLSIERQKNALIKKCNEALGISLMYSFQRFSGVIDMDTFTAQFTLSAFSPNIGIWDDDTFVVPNKIEILLECTTDATFHSSVKSNYNNRAFEDKIPKFKGFCGIIEFDNSLNGSILDKCSIREQFYNTISLEELQAAIKGIIPNNMLPNTVLETDERISPSVYVVKNTGKSLNGRWVSVNVLGEYSGNSDSFATMVSSNKELVSEIEYELQRAKEWTNLLEKKLEFHKYALNEKLLNFPDLSLKGLL